ncbi:hypothetical protein [Lactiplantibacillus pentosus]|nr:hypothetical protein [Lactiplantibacillus pentosus]
MDRVGSVERVDSVERVGSVDERLDPPDSLELVVGGGVGVP